jgi:hypothetical protein
VSAGLDGDRRVGWRLGTAAVAALGARLAWRGLTAAPPGGDARWARTNHRGEPLTLLEGPAYVLAAAGTVAVVPGLPARVRAAGVVAAAGAASFGLADDLGETGSSKGLRGHLGELARSGSGPPGCWQPPWPRHGQAVGWPGLPTWRRPGRWWPAARTW